MECREIAFGWRTQLLMAGLCGLLIACSDDDETGAVAPPSTVGQVAMDAATTLLDASPSSGDSAPPTHTKTSTPWCAARAVFQDACVSCHAATPLAGAPMSLETFADATAASKVTPGKKVHELIASRVHDVERPMPPQRKLSADELAAIDAWVAAGAPEGSDPNCTAGGVAPSSTESKPGTWPPVGCEEVYQLRAGNGQKAVIPVGQEIHPQFIFDAPWGDDSVQALGFRPLTDNAKVVHHWILYENRGRGQGPFLNSWAPGLDRTEQRTLPDNVGVYMPKGPQSLRLDMHYFNVTGTQDEFDESGVEVCVTRNFRPIMATTFMGFTALPYIGPGEEKDIIGTCKVNITEPVYLMAQNPHAHTLANWMKLVVNRGAEKIVLHDGPFRFEEQLMMPINPFFELKQGDVVKTTCHYRNDTNRFVLVGESTTAEMCFNFVTYFPMGALSCDFGGLLGG